MGKSPVEVNALEGAFRLRSCYQGQQLVLEQRRADGGWQIQLTLNPGILADSLARTTSPNAQLTARTLTLRGATSRATLHVFFQSLTRYQKQDSVGYDFDAQALLELSR